ncbi:MAG TPA: ABC transporter ATP-binding protein [Nitrolancea sp.]|nr:ABC transporter ATP-binding protein [Nitrolancea sp.]
MDGMVPRQPSPNGVAGSTPMRTDDIGAAPVIRARSLSKHYGEVQAVKDVSFTVNTGDVYGFLGPNGSGKSTTIAMMLGLVQPTSGQIDLFGLGPARRSEGLMSVGAIIESPTFYPYLSGRDNMRVLARTRDGVTDARISEVLEIIGLSDSGSKRYGNYSLGMKQRLGIGSTLLHDPDLLVLDEPTNGLDPAGMLEVRHLIQRLADGGKTIFISSHLLNEVEQVCNRVAILSKGKIMAEGSTSDISRKGQAVRVRVDEPVRAKDVLNKLDGISSIDERDGYLTISVPASRTPELNVALVQAGIAVYELGPAGNSLEHVFLEITGASEEQRADAHLVE